MNYTNPILSGFYPDPSVCRVGDDFYMVTSTFEWFPGVPVFHSKDLVNWTQIGHCLTRKSQLNLDHAKSSGGIYAPTIRYHDGVFYMITTDTTGIRNFIVTATDPAGKWSEPMPVEQGGIDPSLFWDDDGKAYFTANTLWCNELSPGLYLREIDPMSGELLDHGPKYLWNGTGGKYPEAPHLYKKDGWYYLIIAEGGTELTHRISVARSRTVSGPYESYENNPILSHAGSAHPIQATGHGDLFEDANGDWWIVFLAVRHVGYPLVHHLGRETYLAPVTWNAEGWPIVNDGRYVDLKMEVDRPRTLHSIPAAVVRDAFTNDQLALTWNFRRNLDDGAWALDAGAGQLALKCLPENLDGIGETALIARRLQHFYARIETEIEFEPVGENEEAGLTVLMNEKHHCEIALTQREGRRAVILRKRCASMVTEAVTECPLGGAVRLRVQAEEEVLTFFVIGSDARAVELGTMETRLLSTEMAGGFTGLYTGMYATANGQSSVNTATFNWFDYEPANHAREWDRSLESEVTDQPEN